MIRYITAGIGLRMETARGLLGFGHELTEVIRNAKNCPNPVGGTSA